MIIFFVKSLYLPSIHILLQINEITKKILNKTDIQIEDKIIFICISALVIGIIFAINIISILLFHTNDPRFQLPWAFLSTKFSIIKLFAKTSFIVLFCFETTNQRAWIFSGILVLFGLILIILIFSEPVCRSHLVFFIEIMSPSIMLCISISVFIEFVFFYLSLYLFKGNY